MTRNSGHYAPFFQTPAVGPMGPLMGAYGPLLGAYDPILGGLQPPSNPDSLISTIGLPIVKILSIKKVISDPF